MPSKSAITYTNGRPYSDYKSIDRCHRGGETGDGADLQLSWAGGSDGGDLVSEGVGVGDDGVGGPGTGGGHGGWEVEGEAAAGVWGEGPRGRRVPAARGAGEEAAEETARGWGEEQWARHGPHSEMVARSNRNLSLSALSRPFVFVSPRECRRRRSAATSSAFPPAAASFAPPPPLPRRLPTAAMVPRGWWS